jgi:hypothetical protein
MASKDLGPAFFLAGLNHARMACGSITFPPSQSLRAAVCDTTLAQPYFTPIALPAGFIGRYRINRRPTSQRPLSERWRMFNRARSRTRARGEHAFRVVKQLWGFAKVRYRGLAKNLARAQTMFELANLY